LTAPRWSRAFWAATTLFLSCTALFYFCPDEPAWIRRAVHFLSFEFEQNLGTWFEGSGFLLLAVLAFERSLEAGPVWAWRALSALGLGLSLDELCSIHERSDLLFKPIGLDGQSLALLPFAIPAVLIACVALAGFYRAGEKRRALLLSVALLLLASVVLQEKIEHRLHHGLPAAFAPWRGVIEEGTELLALYCLLSLVLARRGSLLDALPGLPALRRLLLPVSVLVACAAPTLLYVGWVTRIMQRGRGIPMAFAPYLLTTLAALVALRAARDGQAARGRLILLGMLALFFSLDEVAVLERDQNVRLMRSVLEIWALPVLGGVAMLVRRLRSWQNAILLGTLFVVGYPVLVQGGRLWPWLAAPIQMWGLLHVLIRGLACEARPAS
jgi:hypothetical protein